MKKIYNEPMKVEVYDNDTNTQILYSQILDKISQIRESVVNQWRLRQGYGFYEWKSVFNWVAKKSYQGIYLVELDGKYNHYVPKENRFISDMWFDMSQNFGVGRLYTPERWQGMAVVKNNIETTTKNGKVVIKGKYNVLKLDGTLLLTDWVDYLDNYSNWDDTIPEGFYVANENKEYVIDCCGNVIREFN